MAQITNIPINLAGNLWETMVGLGRKIVLLNYMEIHKTIVEIRGISY